MGRISTETVHVRCFGNKTTDQTETYGEYISRRLLRLDLAGGTTYGNVVKEDMNLVGASEKVAGGSV